MSTTTTSSTITLSRLAADHRLAVVITARVHLDLVRGQQTVHAAGALQLARAAAIVPEEARAITEAILAQGGVLCTTSIGAHVRRSMPEDGRGEG